MKEKRTYRRFNLVAFLAILGCAGMLLFECIFIFELYDRVVEQPELPVPAIAAPAVTPAPARGEPVEPARREPVEPARREPVEPVEAPVITAKPVEPARREPVEPIVTPVTPVTPAAPAEVPPAEIETAPAAAPVG